MDETPGLLSIGRRQKSTNVTTNDEENESTEKFASLVEVFSFENSASLVEVVSFENNASLVEVASDVQKCASNAEVVNGEKIASHVEEMSLDGTFANFCAQILLEAEHPYCLVCGFISSDWDLIHQHTLRSHPELSVKKEIDDETSDSSEVTLDDIIQASSGEHEAEANLAKGLELFNLFNEAQLNTNNPDFVNKGTIANLNTANPDNASTDISSPDTSNVDTADPDTSNVDIANSDSNSPKAFNVDIANSDNNSPKAFNVDFANPDIAKPDIAIKDTVNPNTSKVEIANPYIKGINTSDKEIAITGNADACTAKKYAAVTDTADPVINTCNMDIAYPETTIKYPASPNINSPGSSNVKVANPDATNVDTAKDDLANEDVFISASVYGDLDKESFNQTQDSSPKENIKKCQDRNQPEISLQSLEIDQIKGRVKSGPEVAADFSSQSPDGTTCLANFEQNYFNNKKLGKYRTDVNAIFDDIPNSQFIVEEKILTDDLIEICVDEGQDVCREKSQNILSESRNRRDESQNNEVEPGISFKRETIYDITKNMYDVIQIEKNLTEAQTNTGIDFDGEKPKIEENFFLEVNFDDIQTKNDLDQIRCSDLNQSLQVNYIQIEGETLPTGLHSPPALSTVPDSVQVCDNSGQSSSSNDMLKSLGNSIQEFTDHLEYRSMSKAVHLNDNLQKNPEQPAEEEATVLEPRCPFCAESFCSLSEHLKSGHNIGEKFHNFLLENLAKAPEIVTDKPLVQEPVVQPLQHSNATVQIFARPGQIAPFSQTPKLATVEKITTECHADGSGLDQAQVELQCPRCAKKFADIDFLTNHLHLKHKFKDSNSISIILDKKFVCDHCSRPYSSNLYLQRHIRRFTAAGVASNDATLGNLEDVASRDLNARSDDNEAVANHGSRFRCTYCDFSFPNFAILRRHHVLVHQDHVLVQKDIKNCTESKSQLRCCYCKEAFSKVDQLRSHLISGHSLKRFSVELLQALREAHPPLHCFRSRPNQNSLNHCNQNNVKIVNKNSCKLNKSNGTINNVTLFKNSSNSNKNNLQNSKDSTNGNNVNIVKNSSSNNKLENTTIHNTTKSNKNEKINLKKPQCSVQNVIYNRSDIRLYFNTAINNSLLVENNNNLNSPTNIITNRSLQSRDSSAKARSNNNYTVIKTPIANNNATTSNRKREIPVRNNSGSPTAKKAKIVSRTSTAATKFSERPASKHRSANSNSPNDSVKRRKMVAVKFAPPQAEHYIVDLLHLTRDVTSRRKT